MPLLRKKEFQKTSVPEMLRDDEEVFHCEVTNEIFRDYDEFCQRVILVNSMVWQCSMTGKSNLTYAEARQSEAAALRSLNDFPVELKVPVLYLATKTNRTAFRDMVEDVFAFVKDRYFVGEIVESTFTENNWKESHIWQVIAPSKKQLQSHNNSKSPERGNFLPAALYRYEVEQLDAHDQDSSQWMVVEASHVRRRKGPFTKEKNRLFLKQHVEQSKSGLIVIKSSVIQKFNLDQVKFEQIFDGPLPDFEQNKRPKPVVNGKKVKQETLVKYLSKSTDKQASEAEKKTLLKQMMKKEEEYQKKCEDMQQKRAENKLLEAQKKKEEKMKELSYVKEWYKPRDDLELEDQKMLPVPTLVQCKIPAKYFGDALMVLEFANSFSSILCTRDYFPEGLTMDLLERALTEKELTIFTQLETLQVVHNKYVDNLTGYQTQNET